MKDLSLARQIRRQNIAEASSNVATAYFGPEVEAGYSYGSYNCPDCNFEQISNKGEIIHCVNCGVQTDFVKNVSAEVINKIKTNVELFCNTCGSKTLSSSLKVESGMFCTQCSSVMETVEGDD